MKLNDQLLLRIAEWKPGVDDWPNDVGDAESLARYRPLIDALESLSIVVQPGNGHEYGETFFRLFLYKSQGGESFEGLGLYVALCRFAPIGIYGEERRAWGLAKKSTTGLPWGDGYAGFPSLENVYRVSDPELSEAAKQVQGLMLDHNVYLPPIEELAEPITFAIPKLFSDNANLGKDVAFDILFNDLY